MSFPRSAASAFPERAPFWKAALCDVIKGKATPSVRSSPLTVSRVSLPSSVGCFLWMAIGARLDFTDGKKQSVEQRGDNTGLSTLGWCSWRQDLAPPAGVDTAAVGLVTSNFV